MARRPTTGAHYISLYQSLELTYHASARQWRGPREGPHGINAFAFHGLAAFMLTAAIWESVLNFSFFSPWARIYFGDKAAQRCQSLGKELDRLSLVDKTYALPLIAFEKSFDKGTVLFQELKVLVSLRNHIVHDWIDRIPDKEIDHLRRKDCLLTPIGIKALPAIRAMETWQQEVSTFESIRWCMNLLPRLSAQLATLSGHPGAKKLDQFPTITIGQAKQIINPMPG